MKTFNEFYSEENLEQLDESFKDGYYWLVRKLLPAIAKKFSGDLEEIRKLGKPSEKVAQAVAQKYTPNGFKDLGVGGLMEEAQLDEGATEVLIIAARVCVMAFVGTAAASQGPAVFAAWLLITAAWLVASTFAVTKLIRAVFQRNKPQAA